MSDQQPTDWQWCDDLWGDTPTAPSTPEQVPDPDDDRWAGWPSYLRRLMRWASR